MASTSLVYRFCLSLLVINLILQTHAYANKRSKQSAVAHKFASNTHEEPSLILGRPEDDAITFNILAPKDCNAFIEYGMDEEVYSNQTPTVKLQMGNPSEIVVKNLHSNTRYHYRLQYKFTGEEEYLCRAASSFQTQRDPGEEFTFAIQADSHLGTNKHNDPELYSRTLSNVLHDRPDFLIDLGDTFRATKLNNDRTDDIQNLFLNQRRFFSDICHSVPLFLVLGNHDHEWGWDLAAGEKSLSAQMTITRNRYYPNPVPSDFYSGNSIAEKDIGLPGNYYAWEWGDALFIALDIYRHTEVDPKQSRDSWDWTLGDAQYHWLQRTLEESRQGIKFVFLHHLHGTCRGGVEWVDHYEWGGKDRKGNDVFHRYRPDWTAPIHQLLSDHGVTAVFQGHDHIFVSQVRDKIAYITCPMPGDPGYNAYNRDAFHSGVIRPNSGHVRVRVSPHTVVLDYIHAFLPKDETLELKNGTTAFSQIISIKTTDSE